MCIRDSYTTVARWMLPQKIHGSRRVFNRSGPIKALVQLHRLRTTCFVGRKFNSRLLSPEEIGTYGQEAVIRVPLDYAPHVRVDTEDLLKDHYPRSKPCGRY